MNFLNTLLGAAITITPPDGVTLGQGTTLEIADPTASLVGMLPTIMSILGIGVLVGVCWWVYRMIRKATGASK